MHATLKPVIGHQAESAHREITWAWNPASGETRCWAQVTRSDLRVQGPNVRTTSKEFLVRTPSKGTFQPIGARLDPAAPDSKRAHRLDLGRIRTNESPLGLGALL